MDRAHNHRGEHPSPDAKPSDSAASLPFGYIEDALAAKPPAGSRPLTDAELADGGLVPIKAFARTRKTTNALRVEKSRAKAEATGKKQLNLTAPADEPAREALKQTAAALLEGRLSPDLLRGVVAAVEPAPTPLFDDAVLAAGPDFALLRLAYERDLEAGRVRLEEATQAVEAAHSALAVERAEREAVAADLAARSADLSAFGDRLAALEAERARLARQVEEQQPAVELRAKIMAAGGVRRWLLDRLLG